MSGHAASAGVESSIARGIFVEARPIFVGQVAVMLYGVVDTVLTGHAWATDLAAMGVGTGVYSSVFVSLLGAINALNPIVAQHHDGRRHVPIGTSYVQGLWLALLLSIAGGLFLAFPRAVASAPAGAMSENGRLRHGPSVDPHHAVTESGSGPAPSVHER